MDSNRELKMKLITLKQNGTFEHQWIESVHGDSIPQHVIEVTDAVFMQLSQNQAKKYDPVTKIVSDYIYTPTQTELDDIKAGEERTWRDAELKRADIEISKAEDTVGVFDAETWRSYRIALRDWPESVDFPDTSKRPVSPA